MFARVVICFFHKKIKITLQDHFSEGLGCPFAMSEDLDDLLLRDNEVVSKNTD